MNRKNTLNSGEKPSSTLVNMSKKTTLEDLNDFIYKYLTYVKNTLEREKNTYKFLEIKSSQYFFRGVREDYTYIGEVSFEDGILKRGVLDLDMNMLTGIMISRKEDGVVAVIAMEDEKIFGTKLMKGKTLLYARVGNFSEFGDLEEGKIYHENGEIEEISLNPIKKEDEDVKEISSKISQLQLSPVIGKLVGYFEKKSQYYITQKKPHLGEKYLLSYQICKDYFDVIGSVGQISHKDNLLRLKHYTQKFRGDLLVLCEKLDEKKEVAYLNQLVGLLQKLLIEIERVSSNHTG